MKKIFILFTMLIATLGVSADNASDARKILDKTAAVVGHKGGAQASFMITNPKTGVQTGTIAIKGNKFCANTNKATMWYDGKTQWLLMKSNNEVNISTPAPAKQQQMNPYTFLSLYKKGYTLSMKSSGKTRVVHMVAQQKGSIPELYVTVDENGVPKQVRLKSGSGWTTIVISNFQAKKLSDGAFVFNSKDYPKAEVIDLR